jgi:hypothetical protein
MEVASRIFDVVTNEKNHKFTDLTIDKEFDHAYWKRVVRLAALLHDIGHSPFSHAPEGLFPAGWDHERMTREIIKSGYLDPRCKELKVDVDDVALLAAGPEKGKQKYVKNLEAILSEIIIGDSFGADRIDYLLRDSHHSGVAYGKFDHYRLIETLRVLPKAYEDSEEPALGVEAGGMQSAEALLLARYFMFSQLYFHPIRRIYDIHLSDFLRVFLHEGTIPIDVEEYLKLTDSEIMTGIYAAYRDPKNPAHDPARRIVERKHFRVLYSRNPIDIAKTTEAGKAICEAASKKFGEDKIRHDTYVQKGSDVTFPVLEKDGRIVSSRMKSEVLNTLPVVKIDTVYVDPSLEDAAKRWLEKERETIIEAKVMRK